MRRHAVEPRADWRPKVEALGLVYHHTDDRPYWNESAYYAFRPEEIDRIDSATQELHEMCLRAAQHIIDHDRFSSLAIPAAAIPAITHAWETEPPSLYGRFDFAYDDQQLKLLEYNADTPTALLEASVVQWHWLQDRFPQLDQFNSIHEKLLIKWQELRPHVAHTLHFYYLEPDEVESGEDLMTVGYLADLASQAGFQTRVAPIDSLGWDEARGCFVDLEQQPVLSVFKLYPWEWLLKDAFGAQLLANLPLTQWIEPIWKMLLSNKGILPILWELFPDHPNLLECYADGPRGMREFVRKPLLSREGGNLSMQRAAEHVETGGPYGDEGFVHQAVARIPSVDGAYPVLGSWVIDGVSAGLGIRESRTPVTDNRSCFVPHVIE